MLWLRSLSLYMVENFYHVVLGVLEDGVPGLRTNHGWAGISQSACIVQTLVFEFDANCPEFTIQSIDVVPALGVGSPSAITV